MDEYFCPNCGATLNDQYGFDPSCGAWTCTSCGMKLMDDDVYDGDTYEGVAWYCDSCGALLNKQSGFSDSCGSWTCTECYHTNPINEDEIYESEDDYNNRVLCPNCNANIRKQWGYCGYEDDWECTECGSKLHREYSFDDYSVVEDEVEEDDKYECPNCGSDLSEQSYFNEYEDEWTCTECGARLHHDYSSEPYEIIEDDEEDDESYSTPSSGHTDYSRTSTYTYTTSTSSKSNSSNGYTPKTEHVKKEQKRSDGELFKQRLKAFFFKRKKIRMKYRYDELLGKNVEDVETKLHNLAFNDIKLIPIKDIYVGSSYRVGQVEQIVISGSSYFVEGDMIPYDAEIIITYHVKREITIPFSERELRKLNYVEAGDKLQNLGFTEIYERPIRDLVTGWIKKDGSVEKITIGNVYPFKKNSVFVYDTEILIEYHTFKKK